MSAAAGLRWTVLGCRDRRRRPACWQSTSSCRGAGAGPGQDLMAPKEKERLELYHVSMNQDRLDHDLILKLLGHIHRHQAPGAMLVFLPGY